VASSRKPGFAREEHDDLIMLPGLSGVPLQLQRPWLLLVNDKIYVAFGGIVGKASVSELAGQLWLAPVVVVFGICEIAAFGVDSPSLGRRVAQEELVNHGFQRHLVT
jgi:hypothetical protein